MYDSIAVYLVILFKLFFQILLLKTLSIVTNVKFKMNQT